MQPGQIPQLPGVYFFKNGAGKTLYIGKASNLRARLGSYFRPLGNSASKLNYLLKEAKKLSWEILNSEVEALIKEAELIKKYRPKYNVLMRDDKNYFYVGFTKEKFPKIFLTHQPRKRTLSADFLGPFTEGASLKSVLKTLRRIFPYCTCKNFHKRLCLNARLGKCLKFCCLEDSEKLMNLAAGFADFSARSPSEVRSEKARQPSESGAGRARMSQKVALVSPTEQYQKNISAIKKILSGKNRSLVKSLKKEMRELSGTKKYEDAGKIRDQIHALEKIFEHRIVIKQDLPSENAKAIHALESILGASNINRIEAYDIANIGGKFAYGSMTVFEDDKIKKDDYRIFKIKTVQGSNDPAMLREVLTRRLRHTEWAYPQVILIDGGKPQLNAVMSALKLMKAQVLQDLAQRDGASRAILQQENMRVLAKFGAKTIKLITLTKNKKHVGDHIFINGRANPMPLDRLPSPLKNLILHLDSEAHRFAISHYRKSHRKSLTKQYSMR
ncbi:MAG: GIY-YIG nuclease family protein [bacterium]|nr:GIY-YIG nuclease family protein [bacterium]